MIYENIVQGQFLKRPNRFIAKVLVNGKEETVHVKNTGRCKELLTENSTVYLQEFDLLKYKNRKTKFDLISVIKNERLINMDSQVPNKVFKEWILESGFFKDIKLVKPEYSFGNSRLDFYVETKTDKILIEVKGVTLEEEGMVYFPDAPTLRGVKHLNELINASQNGYKTYAVFVVQMDNVRGFMPNVVTHKEFGETLKKAQKSGVNVLALCCDVAENSISIKDEVEVIL